MMTVTHSFATLRTARFSSDMAIVLTNHPHIVAARPPRRIRKLKPDPKITRVIVGPLERVRPTISEEEYKARGDAADQLFRKLVRWASQK